MSVATVSRKNPLAVFVTRLSGYVLRSGRAYWTNLCAALCILEVDAAAFRVDTTPGKCKNLIAAASGEQQRTDGSDAGSVLAIVQCLTHCSTEGGEFIERQKASTLVVGEPADAACRVVGYHPMLPAEFEDRAEHSYSSGRNTPSAGSLAAAAFFPTRPGGLPRCHISLKTFDRAVSALRPCADR